MTQINHQKFEKEEKSFWESYGRIYPYLERATPYYRLIRTFGEMIGKCRNERWLDAGAGSGAITFLLCELSNRSAKIDALDFNPVVLTHLRERIKKAQLNGQVNILSGDLGGKIVEEEEIYDGIAGNLVFPYVFKFDGRRGKDALLAVLAEMHRLLKSGGKLVWSTPKKKVNFLWVFLASIKDVLDPRHLENLYYGPAILRYALKIQKKGQKGFYTFLEKNEIISFLSEIGFQDIGIKTSFAGQVYVIKAVKPLIDPSPKKC